MTRRPSAAHFLEWLRIGGIFALAFLALSGLVLIWTAIADYSAYWRTTTIAAEGAQP